MYVTPSPVVYCKLQVYELLALSLAEAVMVCSLDLMDSYYTLSMSSSALTVNSVFTYHHQSKE